MIMKFGKRTILAVIDELAIKRPNVVWASFPLTSADFDRGVFQSVSFAGLANAINVLAWHLEGLVRQNRITSSVVCYIGPPDVRYFVFAWPEEKPDDHACTAILRARDLQYATVPSVNKLLFSDQVPVYNWNRTFEDVADQTFVVLHTSGSTGLPKAVDITHRWVACTDEQHNLLRIDERALLCDHWAGKNIFVSLPPFHAAGLDFFLFSVFFETKLVFGPTDKPPSILTVQRILDLDITDVGLVAPSILTEMANDDEILKKLSTWSSVVFGGGPLPRAVGNAILPYTKPLQVLGSTETHQLFELDKDDMNEWCYHNYHPSLGIEFRPYYDGLHELVFVRDSEKLQAVFCIFSGLDEYSMNDLYEPHPSKPNLWRYVGRTDDIIVLSNGEKFNPVHAEQLIVSHPHVSAAMIVGTGRERPALLIELKSNDDEIVFEEHDAQRVPEEIARLVQQANGNLPSHGQIHPTHIQVLHSRLQRSSKGEVQRLPSVKLLETVIANLYQSSAIYEPSSRNLDFSSDSALAETLMQVINTQVLANPIDTVDDNLFERGFDSLHALRVVGMINNALKGQGLVVEHQIDLQALYAGLCISDIAKSVIGTLNGDSRKQVLSVEEEARSMLARWRSKMTDLKSSPGEKGKKTQVTVLLTGSAGSLGSYILNVLIRRPDVKGVICLNRMGSDAAKQSRLSHERGLCGDFSKVHFIETDSTAECLGLGDTEYKALSDRVTHIVHNAWPVNFNLALHAYEDQISTCFRMIELAHSAKHAVHTTFISSVGVASNWTHGPVPEAPLEDFRVAAPMGYAQSKLVAENLFTTAVSRLEMAVSICRIGQIAGPVRSVRGQWNTQEWFPSLLKTCATLRKIPSCLGAADHIDWIPVDTLAVSLVESVLGPTLGENTEERASRLHDDGLGSLSIGLPVLEESFSTSKAPRNGLEVLHFTNPRISQWSDLVHSVARALDGEPAIVPFDDWLNTVRRALDHSADSGDGGLHEVPAVKLIDFYQRMGEGAAGGPKLSTVIAQRKSQTLRSLAPVSQEWLEFWILQLGFGKRSNEGLRGH
ncbi:hypothetical protein Q7P37_007623 [Cladosporium fusiforme]